MSHESDVPTAEALLERTMQLGQPAAFQALWDGDSGGWMVCLQAVFASGATYTASNLATLRFGGNERLFAGTVPPWPEARVANEIGETLARHFGVPFWFPSPAEPEDDCPAWWERDRAHPCEDCGKPLLPHGSPYLPEEVCYNCHLAREARAELRHDEPADGWVTVLLGPPGEECVIQSASTPSDLRIARLALALAGATEPPAELRLEGDQLRRLEEPLHVEVQTLLARFDGRAARERGTSATGFEQHRVVTFEGRQLELELHFDDLAQDLNNAIGDLETARRAISEGLHYWLVFNRGMTARGDHVLRLLRQVDGVSTIAALAERCRDSLDAGEVRAALVRLAELGHVVVEGDAARLMPTGWHVGG